jgi:hypothetical protein
MAGKFIKGAFIQWTEAFLLPVPNVIVFQFNPEELTHTWSDAKEKESETAKDKKGTDTKAADTNGTQESGKNPLATKGYPKESFSFKLKLDADFLMTDGGPATAALANATGVRTYLAALEMLQYPVNPGGKGFFSKDVDFSAFNFTAGAFSKADSPARKEKTEVPKLEVPTVLFVWGAQRIVPVRVTRLVITEKHYDVLLNPVRAEVDIGLDVLTPDALASATGPLKQVALGAYAYGHTLRQALSAANLANATESVIRLVS